MYPSASNTAVLDLHAELLILSINIVDVLLFLVFPELLLLVRHRLGPLVHIGIYLS